MAEATKAAKKPEALRADPAAWKIAVMRPDGSYIIWSVDKMLVDLAASVPTMIGREAEEAAKKLLEGGARG